MRRLRWPRWSRVAAGAGRWDLTGSSRATSFRATISKPKDYPIHGIDVSKFQGDIDWNAVANSGVKFAWIKATEGGDPRRRALSSELGGGQGRWHPHGAYHFVYWCRPPLEEINNFRTECASRGRRAPAGARRRGDALTSPTCRRHVAQDEAIADMQVMLQEDGAPLPQAADHLNDPRFLRRQIFPTAHVDGLSDLGALDQTPSCREVRLSRAWHFWQYPAGFISEASAGTFE